MSPRVRAGKPSATTRKPTRHQSQTLIPSRPKRLSNLTTTTLLQYCSTIRKNSTTHVPEPVTRARREASSRASAMILQQNEIERSRLNFSHQITANFKRHRSKSIVDIPNEPMPVQIEQPVHSSLTEANLAEHTRLQEAVTNKHQILLKWTEDLAKHGRFSPPYAADEQQPVEIPITKDFNCKSNFFSKQKNNAKIRYSSAQFEFSSHVSLSNIFTSRFTFVLSSPTLLAICK